MKVHKFEKLVQEHLWLAAFIARCHSIYGLERCQTPYGSAAWFKRQARNFIRRNLNYVAFRPWSDNEVLSLQTNRIQTPVNPKDPRGYHWFNEITEITVFWHDAGEQPFARDGIFHLTPSGPITKGQTAGGIMRGIVEFHLVMPTTVKSITFDAVVKRKYNHSTILGDYTNETFDAFLTPPGWVLPWMKTDLHIRRLIASTGIAVTGIEPLPLAA